ncbi:MAG TPA: glycosyltransferase [Acidimicrobiales bacterium]|nr:glycosyltransferase [Acidimicrobiales bacterium]
MSGVTAAVLVAGWALGWVLAGRRRTLPGAGAPRCAAVSVIVPARDEATRLPHLLRALAAEPHPCEILVVDDGSCDRTADVARSAGATVLAAERPAGWTGKAYACWTGARAARGDVLVFLDADVEPAAGVIPALAAAAVRSGGLVSAHPVHRVERPYEALSAGPGLVALLGAGTGGSPVGRWWRRPFAFGPALASPAAAYRRSGGHRAVRGDVADDVALAAAADRAGVPVQAVLGGDRLRYRMYPDGLGRLVEGWAKNLATGGAATPPLRLAAVAAWVTAALQAGGAPVVAAVAGGPARAAIAAYLLFALQFHVLARRIGRFGVAASVLFPVAIGTFVALFVWSTVLTVGRRRVRWRGRAIDVRRAT